MRRREFLSAVGLGMAAAVARNDPGLVLSGPQETLESHLIVFAAEQARNTGRVVAVRA